MPLSFRTRRAMNLGYVASRCLASKSKMDLRFLLHCCMNVNVPITPLFRFRRISWHVSTRVRPQEVECRRGFGFCPSWVWPSCPLVALHKVGFTGHYVSHIASHRLHGVEWFSVPVEYATTPARRTSSVKKSYYYKMKVFPKTNKSFKLKVVRAPTSPTASEK